MLRLPRDEVQRTRRAQVERRRHSLNVELGAEPILIDADPVRLAQVVSNLVDNAAKYTPEQGTSQLPSQWKARRRWWRQ